MTGHLQNARFAWALLGTNLKASLMLRKAFAAQMLFMALNNLTFFAFWWLLMRRVPTIRGWVLGDVQVLFGIVAVAFGLAVTVAGGVRHLGRLIDEGELDTLLVQPKSVLVHAWGLRSQASGFGDAVSGLALIAWSGQVSWNDAPRIAMAIGASAVVFVATGTLFFSLPFWMGRVDALSRQLWELLVTFALYPEPLFGGALRLVLFTLLPAAWVGYVPVRVVHEDGWAPLVLLALAATGYMTLAVFAFSQGLNRYSSGSRFATHG
ncbi:MAG: ABC transporter permease [Vicinamibacterales bacterium]